MWKDPIMLVFKHQIQERPAAMVGVFSDWLNRGEDLKGILVQCYGGGTDTIIYYCVCVRVCVWETKIEMAGLPVPSGTL